MQIRAVAAPPTHKGAHSVRLKLRAVLAGMAEVGADGHKLKGARGLQRNKWLWCVWLEGGGRQV